MSASPPRVLVIEDDDEIRELLRMILSREGFRVECISGGAGAVEKVKDGKCDAILLDLAMPETDGFDVLAQMTESSPEQLRRVMIVTGLSPSKCAEIDLSRIHKLVRKPFEVEELLRETWSCIRSEGRHGESWRRVDQPGTIAATGSDGESNSA
jgi:DNA-binding response OmpR family regulator